MDLLLRNRKIIYTITDQNSYKINLKNIWNYRIASVLKGNKDIIFILTKQRHFNYIRGNIRPGVLL